jgi:hypothetical protein
VTAEAFVVQQIDIMPQVLRFRVPRPIVSVNRIYRRSARGGLFLSSVAKDFKEACRAHAIVATRQQLWPTARRVRAVSVRITHHGTRHDADAGAKIVLYSLEGPVYQNDSCVRSVMIAKGTEATRCVDIEVELLEAA